MFIQNLQYANHDTGCCVQDRHIQTYPFPLWSLESHEVYELVTNNVCLMYCGENSMAYCGHLWHGQRSPGVSI